MWRRSPARALAARLLLFVVFLAAMVSLRACLADGWRAGAERARGLTGPSQTPGAPHAPWGPEGPDAPDPAGAGRNRP